MNYKKIKVVSWGKLRTRDFEVEPALLGLIHEFQFNQSQVRIELPPSEALNISSNNEKRLFVSGYRKEGEREIPTKIKVDSVDILISQQHEISVPEQALTQPPNVFNLFSDKEKDDLEKLLKDYGEVTEKAFDLWLRTMRWKCGYGSIGRPEIHKSDGWGIRLLDMDTKKCCWHSPLKIEVTIGEPIRLKQWNEVGNALKAGIQPPIYYDLMFDADEHIKNGDLKRSVIDLSVACETFIRSIIIQELPNDFNKAFKKYIDEANIRQGMEHFIPKILNEDNRRTFKAIKSDLHKLFDARNTILHSGHIEDLTVDKCNKFVQATRRLILEIKEI